MMNYDARDNDRDNDRNKDGNEDDNAASGSGSDGPVFDPITTPWSHGGLSGDNSDGAAAVTHYVSRRWTIYPTYKYHIKGVP